MPTLTQKLEADIRPTTLPVDHLSRRFDAAPTEKTFANPIIPPASADPWVVCYKGAYYYCESRNQNSLWVRKAECLSKLGEEEGLQIWTAPTLGGNCNAVWAPELHRINDRWYIYYAADDGLNENHRMWVLESVTDDPMGAYRCKGVMDTQGWAIDLTVLNHNGELYGIWSGWPGATNGKQNLYIAPMSNPWTISGDRVLLATPELAWERIEMDICEGPQVLQRHGKVFVVYSASGSWSTDYCLGMIEFKGGSILDPQSWVKWSNPVLSKNAQVWGIGHCSFTQSPDGLEDWIVYHVKTRKKHGWNDRNVHAQRFTWTESGAPHFGSAVAAGVKLACPTGVHAAITAI